MALTAAQKAMTVAMLAAAVPATTPIARGRSRARRTSCQITDVIHFRMWPAGFERRYITQLPATPAATTATPTSSSTDTAGGCGNPPAPPRDTVITIPLVCMRNPAAAVAATIAAAASDR